MTAGAAAARCDSCCYFEPIVAYEDDEAPASAGVPETICRRHPPLGGGWPTVLADDWCGEWRMDRRDG